MLRKFFIAGLVAAGLLTATSLNPPAEAQIGIGRPASVTITGQLHLPAGDASDPSFIWTDDDDGTGTGLFRSAADEVGVAINGISRYRFRAGALIMPNGTAAAPSHTFSSGVDLGMYFPGADNVGFSVGGVLVFDIEDTNAAGGSANLATISSTLGIMDGSDTVSALSIELTNVDHTGTGNTVNLISIAAITGDAHSNLNAINIGALTGTTGSDSEVESAINIAAGWDNGILLTPPTDGANLDAGNYLQGLVRMEMLALGVLDDGTSAAVEILIDDTPAGEWTEVDAGTEVTTDFTETAVVRKGTNSMQITWTDSAIDGDGVINAMGAGDNLESLESIGFWHRCVTTTTAGDLELNMTEATGDVQFSIPAIAVADTWEWVEIDITSLDAGTGDAVTDLEIQLSGQGVAAAQAFDCFFDYGFMWDLADETALSRDVLVDGVVSLLTVVDAQGTGNTMTNRVEGTDYIINYQSGDDVLVSVDDLSTFTAMILVFLAEDPNP